MSVAYYDPVFGEDGKIYSIDNLRIEFEISSEKSLEFSRLFMDPYRVDIESWPVNTKENRYKHMWTLTYVDDDHEISSSTVGYVFNSISGSINRKGFLDVNPNKCGWAEQFWKDFEKIRSCSITWNVKRIDVAIDVKTKRENVYLCKDNRMYEMKAYSLSNRTEYLGRRNNPGRVKVYNKQEESKTNTPLTRIEITTEPNAEDFYKHYPQIYDISKGSQLDISLMELTPTDMAILKMAYQSMVDRNDEGLMVFNSLGRNKKQKLKPFLLLESALVVASPESIGSLMDKVQNLYS